MTTIINSGKICNQGLVSLNAYDCSSSEENATRSELTEIIHDDCCMLVVNLNRSDPQRISVLRVYKIRVSVLCQAAKSLGERIRVTTK